MGKPPPTPPWQGEELSGDPRRGDDLEIAAPRHLVGARNDTRVIPPA